MTQPSLQDLSQIALLISDVDGTLVHADKTIGAATVAAVKRLRDARIGFTIVSSRPPVGMRYPVETLGIDLPIAAFNGGSLLTSDGRVLKASRLSAEAASITLELLAHEPVETWVYADGLWLVRDAEGAFVPRERRTIAAEPVVVSDFTPYTDRIDKIVAATSDHPRLAEIETLLLAALDGQARASRSQPYYLDVTALDATKGHAVTALAEHIGVPPGRIAVIGDAENDLPMFERAGIAIAMGQATELVRSRAAWVSASNAEDGVAVAIERLLFSRRG